MARYTGASCKLCRREGKKLFLKGERCHSDKCALERRNYAPGQHGQGRKKTSEYGLQLRAKQQARRYYGVLEGQFHQYYEMAVKRKEATTGENLLAILESRLDNVVYRLGWAASRKEARQLVNHGQFTVNGRRVDIPSYLTKVGDVVAVCKDFKDSEKFKAVVESTSAKPIVKWLELDKENCKGKVLAIAERSDIDLDIEETLIVELYSK